jgi:L-asparaginase II
MSQQLHSFAQLGKTQRNCSIRSDRKNFQTLPLNSLGEPAREIFTKKGLAESEKGSELIDFYRGNPL